MNAYFLFQFGDTSNTMILEKPSEAEVQKMQSSGWIIMDIRYKISQL